MNKFQIKELEKAAKLINGAVEMLSTARDIIEPIAEDHQERFDNMSERAQEGDRGQILSEMASNLQTAFESLESAEESANEADGYLMDIINE